MAKLILVRHGQSQWNLENRFTGWMDVPLTEKGIAEAREAGQALKDAGIVPSCAFTSVLSRAIKTLNLMLEEMDRLYLDVTKDWRLNERHYGDLQGYNKAEMAEKVGEEQVFIWRRSFDIPPPALELGDDRHPAGDPRYEGLTPEQLPLTESLKDTIIRVLPYYDAEIAPKLKAGEDVIIAAHGNSLRALVKHLEGISDEDILKVEIATGSPIVFELDGDLNVLGRQDLIERAPH